MSAIRFLPLVALLFACGGNDGGDDSGGSSAIEDGRFSEFIFVDREGVSVTGDFTGLPDGGNVWADTPWLTQTVIAAGDLSVEATVEDFQEDTLEPDRSVDLWFVDAVTATPDQSTVSDVNGAVSMAAKSCQMMVYRVDGDPSRAKRTYKGHHSYSPEADGVIDDALFVSVSDITYKLIPSLLGLTVDVDKAIIAGTAYDIMRDAGLPSDVDLGKIEGAQVIVYGIVPQIMPAFAGISVFRWDINVRESTVLGLVGAGGIGLQLQASLNVLAWPQVTLILIAILCSVIASEWLSARVRHAMI